MGRGGTACRDTPAGHHAGPSCNASAAQAQPVISSKCPQQPPLALTYAYMSSILDMASMFLFVAQCIWLAAPARLPPWPVSSSRVSLPWNRTAPCFFFAHFSTLWRSWWSIDASLWSGEGFACCCRCSKSFHK